MAAVVRNQEIWTLTCLVWLNNIPADLFVHIDGLRPLDAVAGRGVVRAMDSCVLIPWHMCCTIQDMHAGQLPVPLCTLYALMDKTLSHAAS